MDSDSRISNTLSCDEAIGSNILQDNTSDQQSFIESCMEGDLENVQNVYNKLQKFIHDSPNDDFSFRYHNKNLEIIFTYKGNRVAYEILQTDNDKIKNNFFRKFYEINFEKYHQDKKSYEFTDNILLIGFRLACNHNCIDVVKWLYQQNQELISHIATNNQVMLQYSIVAYAASMDYIDLLKWYYEITDNFSLHDIKVDENYELLNIEYKEGLFELLFNIALAEKNLNTVNWIIRENNTAKNLIHAFLADKLNVHQLDIIKFMFNGLTYEQLTSIYDYLKQTTQ